MNYLKIEHEDVCNGTGLRCTIWLTSCSHGCPWCFNKETWNPDSGIPFDESAKQEIFDELSKDYISGITLTGGDPLHENNLDEVLLLIQEIRSSYPDKTIWLYTGYTFEECKPFSEEGILPGSKFAPHLQDILKKRWEIISNVNVLVDGEYIDEQRDITLKWCGSSNQRVIDVKQTIKEGRVIILL